MFQNNRLIIDFASFGGDHERQEWHKLLHDFELRVFKGISQN